MFKIKKTLSLILLMIGGMVGALLPTHFLVAQDFDIIEGSLTGKSFRFIMPNHALSFYAMTEPNTYTIYFDGNGGVGTMAELGMVYDKMGVNLPLNEFTRDGFTFEGWSRNSGGPVEFLDQTGVINLVDSGSVVLYAQWKAEVSYVIQYCLEKVTGSGCDIEIGIGQGSEGTGIILTGKSYTGFTLQTGDVITIVSGGTVQYRYKRNTYNLTIKDRDEVLVDTGVKYGYDIPLPPNPEWTGNTFLGWNNLPGDGKMPAENLVLTGKWSYGVHTVTFDTDEGSYIAPITGEYGDIINISQVPTKSGYKFIGWSPALPITLKGDDVVVRAIWVKNDSSEGMISWRGRGRGRSRNEKIKDVEKEHGSSVEQDTGSSISPEMEVQIAYEWAYSNGITTLSGLWNADPDGYIPRGHMAKMVVNFVGNVLKKKIPSTIPSYCSWGDPESAWESQEIKEYAEKACALGIMGIRMNDFMPNKLLDRAEFGTIISRLLWGDKYNVIDTNNRPYYIEHLSALKSAGIMTQIDNPKYRLELRKWAWLMFMRAKL